MYTELPQIYDWAMKDAPYEKWLAFLQSKFPLAALHVADVGCGTGKLTVELAKHSSRVLGVDVSDDMLTQAAQGSMDERVLVQWLAQDVRDLRLPGTVDLVISTTDVFNYLLSDADLDRACRAVYANLRPGGWFCFDVHGLRKMERLREGTWYEVAADYALFYETDVTDTGRIRYQVHAFMEEQDGRYRRFDEHHVQQFYPLEHWTKALESAGFVHVSAIGDFGQTPIDQADRWVICAQRP